MGRVCEVVDTATVTIWVDTDPETEPQVSRDGKKLDAKWGVVQGGLQTQVQVTRRTKALALHGDPAWRLPVVVWERPRALIEADKLRRSGKLDEAEAALKGLDKKDVRLQSEAETLRGKIAAARGDTKGGIARLQKAAALAEQAGLLSKPVIDRAVATFHAIHNARDLALARSLIAQMRAEQDFDEAAVRSGYYAAVLATEVGDLRSSVRAFSEVERTARRLRMFDVLWASKQERAHALGTTGQHPKALELLREIASAPRSVSDSCSEATALANLAWAEFLDWESNPSRPIVLRDAQRSLRLFKSECSAQAEVANLLVTLAHLDLAAERTEEAASATRKVRELRVLLRPQLRVWLLEAEARLAAKKGRWNAALQIYAVLEELGRDLSSAGAVWRAIVGRASVLSARRDLAAAIAAYRMAELQLDRDALGVAIGGARGHFFASRRRHVNAHVALLIDAGRIDEAVAVIRRARARVVRGLRVGEQVRGLTGDARRRWERAVTRHGQLRDELDESFKKGWGRVGGAKGKIDEQQRQLRSQIAESLDEAMTALAPATARSLPPISDLTIGYHPASNGWIGFVATEKATRIERIMRPNLEQQTLQTAALLAPFSKELRKAEHVHFLVPPDLASMDLHALRFQGKLLIESHTVSYGVDLERREASRAATVAIISDALGNLPAARDEAALVHRLFSGRKRAVRNLTGAAVTRTSLVDALASADHLHYAGHGKFDGDAGWDSHLSLADGARFTVGDILALPRVPRTVVLSGCETGKTSALEGAQLGLAQAFVIAGAAAVVAAQRPVQDETARALSKALYQSKGEDLIQALRGAQLTLRAENPNADWSAFRVITR